MLWLFKGRQKQEILQTFCHLIEIKKDMMMFVKLQFTEATTRGAL